VRRAQRKYNAAAGTGINRESAIQIIGSVQASADAAGRSPCSPPRQERQTKGMSGAPPHGRLRRF
jgi:hypothetical protein